MLRTKVFEHVVFSSQMEFLNFYMFTYSTTYKELITRTKESNKKRNRNSRTEESEGMQTQRQKEQLHPPQMKNLNRMTPLSVQTPKECHV